MDKLPNLNERLKSFTDRLEKEHREWMQRTMYKDEPERAPRYEFGSDVGYKYARIYCNTGNQKIAKYFVDVRSGDIYECKSWTQANTRRWYGTLDTLDEWTWGVKPPRPLAGTESERLLYEREEEIKAAYQKRGRKPK